MSSSKRNNNRRRKRGPRRAGPRRSSQVSVTGDGKSFRGQPMSTLVIKSGPVVLSTTAGTGLVSYVQPIDVVADVPSWASRFESLFQEYRLVKVVSVVTALSNTTGLGHAWYNEVNASPPTFPESTEQGVNRFPLSVNSSKSFHRFVWKPRTINDMVFSSTAVSFVPASFKFFTNNANYGSSLTALQVVICEYEYTVQFRGYST